MASDLETKAKEAFIDDHFELALHLYSQAIQLNPKHAELYADRAQANIKLDNLPEAVADANKAIELDPSMSKAYLRKATACMKLEEYQTAKSALETGAALAPAESRFSKLIKECEERIAEETGDLSMQTPEALAKNDVPAKEIELDKDQPNLEIEAAPPKPVYRYEFYQKPEEVVFTIFAKGTPHDCVKVDYGEQILSVAINAPGKEAYHFQPRLFAKIIPEKCRYDVLSTKVEIRLAKAEPIHWTSLEFSREVAITQRVNVSSVSASQRPSYPSSKPQRVDWDKIEAQVKKEQEKDEKLDGDAALNKFFRDIYKDADEDTRRAMQKSFVESNGTVLSTNWKEVGAKKVEGSPPDGPSQQKLDVGKFSTMRMPWTKPDFSWAMHRKNQ
ncbi:Protein SGT1 B [Gossypium arboreum]|uniref:Protein SGT1 homolog n=1 Tax=Gossypium arboreum TaxID=29729 RepID=A0A0B0N051_GOSAR|nr:Protein SGT1 B [Gossypium arboreum]